MQHFCQILIKSIEQSWQCRNCDNKINSVGLLWFMLHLNPNHITWSQIPNTVELNLQLILDKLCVFEIHISPADSDSYSYTRASVGGRYRYLAYPSWLLGLKCYWAMLLGYEGFHWPVSLNEGSGRSNRKTWRRVQGREVQRRSRIYFCLFWQMIQFLVIAGETRSFSIWYIKWSTRSKFTYLQNMNFIYINSFVQVRRWLTRYIGRERPWILFPCNPRNYLNF